MLTKPEITSPVGVVRCFSALSRGVKVVLINFFLNLLCASLEERKLQLRKVIC